MNARTVRDIELDKVLADVRAHSLSPEGRDAISPELFTSDRDTLEGRAEGIAECISYLGREAPDAFPSATELLDWVSSTHMDFPGRLVRQGGEFISSYISMLRFLGREEEADGGLASLSAEILRSLDTDGAVVDDHPRLLPLQKALEAAKSERLRFSQEYIRQNRDRVQQSEPMFRNERIVIPIKSSEKRTGCYVAGASSSGSTVFAEPFGLVSLNNDVVIAEERIAAEKARILHELAQRVREELVPVLPAMLGEVIDFDFRYSFALWAKRTGAVHPALSSSVSLRSARHPLLGSRAVPIDIAIPGDVRAVVLSGANAGGKTVSMKTVALLAAINQIAGYIPAAAESALPLFSSIFTDIGDGQSIEDSASTFSSHMGNIASIARKMDGASLVILDELGSGTDPEEGAALSVAVLRYFRTRAALTMATSHYSAVKSFAYTGEGMLNASMEFDERSGLPTYRVLEGIPGESHAIATARRMSMPKEIVSDAEASLRGGSESSASIIKALLAKERALDRKITESALKSRSLDKEKEALAAKEEELRKLENGLRREGVGERASYLRESRKTLENLIADIRTGKLTTEKIHKAKDFMKEVERKKDEEERKVVDDDVPADDAPFLPGDAVICGSSSSRGEVISSTGKEVLVMLDNGLRMKLRSSMVRHAAREVPQKATITFMPSSKKAEYTMDVRGCTLEEALRRLDDQIEAALLSSLSTFSVIHGFGDGILSKGIHQYLSRRREVKDFYFAHPSDGGMGKTYVELF